jgi:hypothetical protein
VKSNRTGGLSKDALDGNGTRRESSLLADKFGTGTRDQRSKALVNSIRGAVQVGLRVSGKHLQEFEHIRVLEDRGGVTADLSHRTTEIQFSLDGGPKRCGKIFLLHVTPYS